MFKIIFQYFDRYDTRCEATLHGETKAEAYAKAYDWSLKNGDGDYSVLALYDMTRKEVA